MTSSPTQPESLKNFIREQLENPLDNEAKLDAIMRAIEIRDAHYKAKYEGEPTWWVTMHDVPDEPRKIAGPFTTQRDASLCREQLESREHHRNYWLEELQPQSQEGDK